MRRLGLEGPAVFRLALGCAAMSAAQGQATDDAGSMATIHEAIERGVNLLDTADFYGGGRNELLIGKAMEGRRDKVLLSGQIWRPAIAGRRVRGFGCAARFSEEFPDLHADSPWRGSRRCIPPGAA